MATEPSSAQPSAQPSPVSSSSWLHARALWAGVSIITIWLAVLFVGVFGGDFIASSSSGFTKIPIVVFLLPFALPATIVVARRGLTSSLDDERRGAIDESAQARTETLSEPSALRARPA